MNPTSEFWQHEIVLLYGVIIYKIHWSTESNFKYKWDLENFFPELWLKYFDYIYCAM